MKCFHENKNSLYFCVAILVPWILKIFTKTYQITCQSSKVSFLYKLLLFLKHWWKSKWEYAKNIFCTKIENSVILWHSIAVKTEQTKVEVVVKWKFFNWSQGSFTNHVEFCRFRALTFQAKSVHEVFCKNNPFHANLHTV